MSRLLKLGHFVGSPQLLGPPIFLNSMPKAGTNIGENLLVALGYKRNWARCLNETNLKSTVLRPKNGRFYVGHIFDDEPIHTAGFHSIYLTRDVWSCLKSYVNYMFIDRTHPVSRFLRNSSSIDAIRALFLTNENPNHRPLVAEYTRFHRIDKDRYDVVLSFEQLLERDSQGVKQVAKLLGVDDGRVHESLTAVLAASGFTKNMGRIDLFKDLEPTAVAALRRDVEARSDGPEVTDVLV